MSEPCADPATPSLAPELDGDVLADARALVAARPELGRLGPLLVWLAGVQGVVPPRPFATPVALVVASAHDEARYVGRWPPSALADRVAAVALDLPHRVVDLGADGPWFVRASSADVRRADALERDEALAALALGQHAVDREVDGGCDLLLVGDVAVDSAAAVATLAAVLTGAQPQALVDRRGLSTQTWIRTVEVVRDARARARHLAADPLALLAAVGGADLACLAGALVQAARRRTPVLLSGVAAHVAGLVAEAHAPGSALWWSSASASGDPAEMAAAARLELDPLLALDLAVDACGGGVLAYALVQEALRLVAPVG